MVEHVAGKFDSVGDRLELPAEFGAPRASVDERMAQGKALRARVPHERHAEYKPPANRRDPVEILEERAKTRLPQLVPIRYARMLTSPFAFLRGSAAVMAADLAPTAVTGLEVQACGDLHVANFGVFASAERNLVFGINDFDETLPGPWEWDLKRLAASLVVAGRFLGADDVLCDEGVRALVRSYRKRMREYAQMSYLDVWYSRIDEPGILDVLSPDMQKRALKLMAKARQRGHMQVLGKMAELVDNQHRIVESAPLIVRETHTQGGLAIADVVSRVMEVYKASLPEDRRVLLSRYRIVDVARKVVGVGSVGTRCWIILLEGNGPDDPLFLQYKEAQPSVLSPYVKGRAFESEGQRVVVGQRTIQGAPDIFLGWGKVEGGPQFYMRQLRDMKGGIDFTPGVASVKGLPDYAKLCGWATAMAHAKSGDAAAIAGYAGKSDSLDEAISRIAFAYAMQTERDHDALAKAAKAKRIEVAKAAV